MEIKTKEEFNNTIKQHISILETEIKRRAVMVILREDYDLMDYENYLLDVESFNELDEFMMKIKEIAEIYTQYGNSLDNKEENGNKNE
jgi:RNAse (barnase) inhibitor barstar